MSEVGRLLLMIVITGHNGVLLGSVKALNSKYPTSINAASNVAAKHPGSFLRSKFSLLSLSSYMFLEFQVM